MSYLRHISTRRLLALCRRGRRDPRRQRGGDRPRGRRVGTDAAAQAARAGRARRARRPAGRRRHGADLLHQPPHRRRPASRAATRCSRAPRAACGPPADKLRLELQASSADGRAGDVQVLLDGDRLTVIETGVEHRLPGDAAAGRSRRARNEPVPSLARIQDALTHLAGTATLSGAQPSDVAGRPAYTVRISPRHDGGLLGGAEVAWDAEHGVPLRAAVYASGSRRPGARARGDRHLVRQGGRRRPRDPRAGGRARRRPQPAAAAGSGAGRTGTPTSPAWPPSRPRSASRSSAPDTLVGLPRKDVKLVDLDGTPGALVTYGQGLGGIAVLQSPAKAQPQTQRRAAATAAAA